MRNVKIHYSIRDNVGDAINPYIVERVLGCNPVHADVNHCEVSGIGSGLGRFLYDPNQYRLQGRFKRTVMRYLNQKQLVLWSSGFIKTPTGAEQKLRINIVPAAVRGKKSLEYVKRILRSDCTDCVTGDAGLLAAELLESPISKRYALGIIPHDKERGNPVYQQICEQTPHAVLIDVRGDVMERLKLIAQCECILSSSLHGLIIADSFHIPNRRVILTDQLAGDGFKFLDYYSNFDIQPEPLNLRKIVFSSVNDIYDNYSVLPEFVEQKKKELYGAFKRYF